MTAAGGRRHQQRRSLARLRRLSWGYQDLLRPQRSRLGVLAPAAVIGAVLGCLLLLVTSEEAFARVVPWLVIVGALRWPCREE